MTLLQAVWPVTDETFTTRELVDEATADLDRLAEQAHAEITGPPVWSVHPAEEVPGWGAYAPGLVLVAYVPVDVTAPALTARAAVKARRELIVELDAAGWSAVRIAEHLDVQSRTVFRDLAKAGQT